MKVKDVMMTDVAACRPDTSLADAAALMFHRDCGYLPVINTEGHLIGVITDRDIAMAVAMKDRTASRINVREAATETVFACGPDDAVTKALDTMQHHRVRRLPVIDDQGHVKGVLSIDDIVRLPGQQDEDAPTPLAIVAALQGICGRDPLTVTGAV